MSEVRLVVREAECDWSGTIHGSEADRAVAALGADPVALIELEGAFARFAKPDPGRRFLANLSPGLRDEPHDAGLVVIDLAARLVVVDSTYSSPGMSGCVVYNNGRCATETYASYHLADEWLIVQSRKGWRQLSEQRRRERAAKPLLDVREVFFGRPLLELVAREVLAAFARRDEIAATVRAKWVAAARRRLADKAEIAPEQVDPNLLTDEEVLPKTWPGEERAGSPFRDTLKDIHAAWMLTPRADLGGEFPREVGLAGALTA